MNTKQLKQFKVICPACRAQSNLHPQPENGFRETLKVTLNEKGCPTKIEIQCFFCGLLEEVKLV